MVRSDGRSGDTRPVTPATLALPEGDLLAIASPPERWTVPHRLLLLGALGASLRPDDLHSSLRETLNLLRHVCQADDSEVFLRDPNAGDMFLTSVEGPDRSAFAALERFGTGTGFPGIMAATNRPVLTCDLPSDNRFLRTSVTSCGIFSYVGVPLPGPHGPVGCVSLAWRRRDIAADAVAAFLEDAARQIAVTVRAGLAEAPVTLRSELAAVSKGASSSGRRFLKTVLELTGADAATLILDRNSGTGVHCISRGRPARVCPGAVRNGRFSCGILARGHSVMLAGPRSAWPEACRCRPGQAALCCCVPLTGEDGRTRGAVMIEADAPTPLPHTSRLVELITVTRSAGPLIDDEVGPVGDPVPVLKLKCFGRFELRMDDRVMSEDSFQRKKALTLLKLLVLKAGNPLNRSALIEHLWPGTDERSGANRLHGVVHALRSVIEPHHSEKRWIFVRSEGDFYYFNMNSPHQIDLYEFRQLSGAARQAIDRGDRAGAIEGLKKAVALYRGDLFEEDCFGDWGALEREHVKNSYVDMLRQLAELLVEEGPGDSAVQYLRQALMADPFREDVHQLLIGTLIQLGRRGEAARQYRRCTQLLREDLGLEPSDRILRLEQLIA